MINKGQLIIGFGCFVVGLVLNLTIEGDLPHFLAGAGAGIMATCYKSEPWTKEQEEKERLGYEVKR
jgi:hypothetical protein